MNMCGLMMMKGSLSRAPSFSLAQPKRGLCLACKVCPLPSSPPRRARVAFVAFCPSSLGSVFLALFAGAMRALQVVAVQASAFLASAYQGVVGKLEPFSQALIKALKLNFGCILSLRG